MASTPSSDIPRPTPEEVDELLLDCRYGDLDAVTAFHTTYGSQPIADARDANQNTVLHMVAANGHIDILNFLLPLLPSPALLSAPNTAGSTPAHWAALNKQLPALKALIEHPSPPSGSSESSESPDASGEATGARLIEIRNSAGRSVLGEAEMVEWEEGAAWLVGVMDLRVGGDGDGNGAAEAEGGVKEGVTNEEVEDVDVGGGGGPGKDVDIEIRDAEGRVAGMTLSSST